MELDMDRDQTYKMKKELIAPVYNVDENQQMNHFKEVVMHAEMIRVLQVSCTYILQAAYLYEIVEYCESKILFSEKRT